MYAASDPVIMNVCRTENISLALRVELSMTLSLELSLHQDNVSMAILSTESAHAGTTSSRKTWIAQHVTDSFSKAPGLVIGN